MVSEGGRKSSTNITVQTSGKQATILRFIFWTNFFTFIKCKGGACCGFAICGGALPVHGSECSDASVRTLSNSRVLHDGVLMQEFFYNS